ncbi:MAG: hypothetical protein IIA59_03100 [Candidatus Marinimicrobia bacterium]|nr:hypothetical protein [Candidatus Neomarinimicrobiota bacterium]
MANSADIDKLFKFSRDLLDSGETRRAVKVGRRAAALAKNEIATATNLGGILIDAGGDLNDGKLIREGVELLKSVENYASESNTKYFHHNLGTGYLALGQRERGVGPGTRPSLSSAVNHFDEALLYGDDEHTRTNLASTFINQGRFIEALDEIETVLARVPEHHVALAKRGYALMQVHSWMWKHQDLLNCALLDREMASELAQNDPLYYEGYKKILSELRPKAEHYEPKEKTPSKMEKWIWDNRLALNPCPTCRVESPEAFDIYAMYAHLEGGNRRPSTNEVIDILNSIHASFSSARWLLMSGVRVVDTRLDGQHVFLDSTEFVVNDLNAHMIKTAFISFYSTLDKIAYAMNSYFHLKHNTDKVDFHNVWMNEKSFGVEKDVDRKNMHQSIKRISTPALSALYHLAQSMKLGLGRYRQLRKIRNNLSHKVVVTTTKKIKSLYYESMKLDELILTTIEIGRISRAAILYFGATLWRAEFERLKRFKRLGMNVVHSHKHVIR